YDILTVLSAKRGGSTAMSALSFVALELQTTHLDPASVSQASYVKLVNGNITRTDTLSVTPPTTNEDLDPTSGQASLTWNQALSQLTMMVGQLPVVSYYRDADKEVFQAASRHIGEIPPILHWLDCRELARKYLPDLPEFQLSTVLKSLDLYDEYGDSNSVEQTTQIVVELARLHKATSVEQLWAELYDQPDQLLGLDTGLDEVNFLADPTPDSKQPPQVEQSNVEHLEAHKQQGEPAGVNVTEGLDETDETLTSELDPEMTHPATVESWNDGEVAPEGKTSNLEGSEALAHAQETAVDTNEQQDNMIPDAAIEDAALTVEVQTDTSQSQDPGVDDSPEQQLAPEEAQESIGLANNVDVGDDQLVAATTVEDAAFDGESELPSSQRETTDRLEPAEVSVATTEPTETVQAKEQPVELAETATAVPQTAPIVKRSRTLRTLGFMGLFGFGLLTIVEIVLTIMAVML